MSETALPAGSPSAPVLCPDCNAPMKLREGGRGPFLGCTRYPACKGTREADGSAKGNGRSVIGLPAVVAAENLTTHLEKLDTNQRGFVAAGLTPGNLQGVAGAGAGKTFTMVGLVGALVRDGVDPGQIIVTTFTRKAGDELLQKCARVVPASALSAMRIGTFHSIALRKMREVAPGRWPLQRCLDLPDRMTGIPSGKTLWKQVLRYGKIAGTSLEGLAIGDDAGRMAADFGGYADLLRADDLAPPHVGTRLSPATVARVRKDQEDGWEKFLSAWCLYEDAKAVMEAWDFADLLEAYLAGLRSGAVADSAAIVVVDEAQDNNRVQVEIARKLSSKAGSKLIFVGDCRQTIYTWRGAYPEAFQNAAVDMNARRVDLPRNYRSGREIVALGNRIAAGQPWSMGAVSEAARNIPGVIRCLPESEREGAEVAALISDCIDEGAAAEDFAILARTNAVVGAFEAALVAARIPCAVVGGVPFFQREEVQDFLAYAILSRMDGWASVARIRNTPKRFLGAAFDRDLETAKTRGLNLVSAIRSISCRGDVAGLAAEIENLRGLPWNRAEADARDLSDGAETVCSRIVTLLTPPERKGRTDAGGDEDRDGLLTTIAGIADSFTDPRALGAFAKTCQGAVATVGEDEAIPGGRVTLSTVHRAKGREWKRVIVSATAGIFPNARAAGERQEAEELRLFYVATTRAMDELYFSCAASDPRPSKYAPPRAGYSRFVEEYVVETEPETAPDPETEDAAGSSNGKAAPGKAADRSTAAGPGNGRNQDAATGRVEAAMDGIDALLTEEEAMEGEAWNGCDGADPFGGTGRGVDFAKLLRERRAARELHGGPNEYAEEPFGRVLRPETGFKPEVLRPGAARTADLYTSDGGMFEHKTAPPWTPPAPVSADSAVLLAARALAKRRTDAEPKADPAGGEGSRYVVVLSASFEELLSPLGFREIRRADQRVWVRESASKHGVLSILVYSSIFEATAQGEARPVGEDSIRIAATWTEAGQIAKPLLPRAAWVARTRGWRQSLLDQLDDVRAAVREAPGCPACGSPQVQREAKNGGGAFWGCCRFPGCRGK